MFVEESHLGVIDSLSAGLNLVAQRVWVIVIPVLLDVWYWLGPQLSIAPLLRQLEQFLAHSAPATIPEAPVNITTVIGMLDALGQQFNLFSLLSDGLLGVPSLMANGSSRNASIIEVRSWLAMIGLVALLTLVGLAIGCLFLTLIAQGVCQQPLSRQALFHQAGEMWLRVVALGLLLLFFGVSLVVPFSFLIGLLTLVSGGMASFLTGLVYVTVIWLGLYLYFAVDAIVINRVGPVRAMWNSANVIARNFWSALGLIILITTLSLGLSLVWQRLGEVHPVGMFIGIAGHAFIGSGLAATSLLFYRDRYDRWQEQGLEIRD